MIRFYYFLRTLAHHRGLIYSMARRAIIDQYVGSALGFVWVVVHPLVMIAVFWVVFGLGFRAQPLADVPFVVWLTAGLAPWFAFVDIVNGSVGIVIQNRNLIKKMAFPSQILPVVKMLAALANHLIFIVLLLVLLLFHGYTFSLYYFQFFYYLGAMLLLSLGLSWVSAALNPFFRDVGHLVQVLVQVGFWATPIFWELRILPDNLQFLFSLNPMHYVVQGYRDSFIYATPFWAHPLQTACFWAVTLVLLGVGGLVFKTLKPHFAEVL